MLTTIVRARCTIAKNQHRICRAISRTGRQPAQHDHRSSLQTRLHTTTCPQRPPVRLNPNSPPSNVLQPKSRKLLQSVEGNSCGDISPSQHESPIVLTSFRQGRAQRGEGCPRWFLANIPKAGRIDFVDRQGVDLSVSSLNSTCCLYGPCTIAWRQRNGSAIGPTHLFTRATPVGQWQNSCQQLSRIKILN